jgi:hypothetical protein
MKYLVVKGWLGFGDRLQTLKMCVVYAMHYNLQIYVDWTDSIWSHGDESFYTYFNIVNIPVLKSLRDIPEDATYYPPYWKDNIHKPFSQELFERQKELNLNLGVIREPFDADVLVHSSIGGRALFHDISKFVNVFRLIDPRIKNEVLDRQRKYPLHRSLGFHIRGTDRTKTQLKKEQSIQLIAANAVMNGAFNGIPMITVSDDKESLDIWKRFHPDTIIFSQLSIENTSAKGNHNASKDEIGVSKDSMNVDMLIDFFTLGSCLRILSTFRDSRFAIEARAMGPHIKTILGNE